MNQKLSPPPADRPTYGAVVQQIAIGVRELVRAASENCESRSFDQDSETASNSIIGVESLRTAFNVWHMFWAAERQMADVKAFRLPPGLSEAIFSRLEAGKDLEGMTMAEMIETLDDAELDRVAALIAKKRKKSVDAAPEE